MAVYKASEFTGRPLTLNKHQQRTEATKRKLLRSALRVFSRDGFEATRIDDIAAEAGYTRGAFYAHFPSKEALFFALVEDQSGKHVLAFSRTFEKCRTAEERRLAFRNYYVSKACDRKWSILILEFKLYALRRPKLRAKLADNYRSIRMNMRWGELGRTLEGQAGWPAENKELIRVILQTMLHGLVVERAYDPSSVSETELSTLLGMVFDVMFTLPPLGREV
ncbi:MAG TPA: TetR/AcrR family transcriptional regulator [Bryobacteraceae bacterium]|jgi:AcrR family transcriptional regulator|nr:TetR/AcrR family transcriptional regulator [Bryobacteraceae bacterium]